jgi:hypothetical protein
MLSGSRLTQGRINIMSSFKKIGGLEFQIRPFTKEDADLDAELAAEKSNDVVGFLSPEVADIYNRFTGNSPQTSTADKLAEAIKRVASNQGPKSPGLHVTERKAPAPEATRTPNEISDALAAVMQKLRS